MLLISILLVKNIYRKKLKHLLIVLHSLPLKLKNIKTNIFRMQAYDSIMCGCFCIGFIDFMVKGKTLTE